MAQNNMTAVEWIEEKMKKLTPPGYQTEISAMLEQAKQMEKEQIINAHENGYEYMAYRDWETDRKSVE